MIERDRAAVRRECADRAEAWYTQGVPESSRDEYAVEIVQLRAAIEGREAKPDPRDALIEQMVGAFRYISGIRQKYQMADNPNPKGYMHMACDKADAALAAWEISK